MTAGTGDVPRLADGTSFGAPGTVLADRYVLGATIGRGGMGSVYRAHDRLLDRDVAVKLLFADATADRELERACAAEARAAARLNHPGVARVFDSGVEAGRCFVVMELVAGRTLAEILADSAPLAIPAAARLAAQVADTLDHAHSQGVVHCDVKPANILVTDEGTAKLVDFGIARAAVLTGTLPLGELRGSAAYMSPEQARGERVDGRSDVYALGAVLFEMLTGRPPFQGASLATVIAQRLVADPPSPRRLNPSVPRDLERLTLTALARDVERRYQTAGEFRDALRAILAGATVELAGTGPTRRLAGSTRAAWRGRRGLVALGAGSLVALALAGAMLVSGWSRMRQPGNAGNGASVLAAPPSPTAAPPTSEPLPVVPVHDPAAPNRSGAGSNAGGRVESAPAAGASPSATPTAAAGAAGAPPVEAPPIQPAPPGQQSAPAPAQAKPSGPPSRANPAPARGGGSRNDDDDEEKEEKEERRQRRR